MLAPYGTDVDDEVDDNVGTLSKHCAPCIVAMTQWDMVMQV